MRILKSIQAGVTLLFICAAANAITRPATGKLTRDEVVKIYIDDTISGNVSNLDNILADDFEFHIQKGDYVHTFDKDQLIDYLKNDTKADPPIKTTTTIIKEDDHSAIIKIEFKYDSYLRIDEVTINKTPEWQITNVLCEFM